MTSPPHRLAALLTRLWRTDVPLTATGLLMTATLLATVAGLWLDPRLIGGAPAWLKPAKFAASTAIYSFTLAWIFTMLPDWPRTRRIVGRTTAVVFIVEVAIISLQAWRGITSHFNAATLLDGVLFSIMGTAIVIQTVVSVAVAVALWRQPFVDRTLGWALRLGFVITIIGASSGGLMTQPTRDQLTMAREYGRMPVAGAHTVGAPDGGPGLPVTGWSRTHGDLRIPHFLGLHAVQLLPFLAFLLGRTRRTEDSRVALTFVTAGSYVAFFVLLTWQALRGQALMQPDPLTLQLFGAWLVLTVGTAWIAARPRGEPGLRTAARRP